MADAGRPSAAVAAWVALGGALGAWLRSLVPGTPELGSVPWPTLAVNVGGSLALGLLVGALSTRTAPTWLRPALGTGLLGGFTTFSTYAVQAAVRVEDQPATAVAYVLVTLVGAVAAAGVGVWLGSRAAGPS